MDLQIYGSKSWSRNTLGMYIPWATQPCKNLSDLGQSHGTRVSHTFVIFSSFDFSSLFQWVSRFPECTFPLNGDFKCGLELYFGLKDSEITKITIFGDLKVKIQNASYILDVQGTRNTAMPKYVKAGQVAWDTRVPST